MKKGFTTPAVKPITFLLITKAQDWYYAFGKGFKNNLNPLAVISIYWIIMSLFYGVLLIYEFMAENTFFLVQQLWERGTSNKKLERYRED